MCLITGFLGFLAAIAGFFGFAFLGVNSITTDANMMPDAMITQSITESDGYELITIFDTDGSEYFLPRQAQQEAVMQALLFGELNEQDGCLTIADYLVVWAPNYDLLIDSDGVAIMDGTGEPLARIGDNVTLSGGEVPAGAFEAENPLFPFGNCASVNDNYWLMGDEFQRTE